MNCRSAKGKSFAGTQAREDLFIGGWQISGTRTGAAVCLGLRASTIAEKRKTWVFAVRTWNGIVPYGSGISPASRRGNPYRQFFTPVPDITQLRGGLLLIRELVILVTSV